MERRWAKKPPRQIPQVETLMDSVATGDPKTHQEEDFSKRNEHIRLALGHLAGMGKRSMIVDPRLTSMPDVVNRLTQNGRRSLADIRAVYENEQRNAEASLRTACGACALRDACEINGNLRAFRQRFPDAAKRRKLQTRLDRSPKTKCDQV